MRLPTSRPSPLKNRHVAAAAAVRLLLLPPPAASPTLEARDFRALVCEAYRKKAVQRLHTRIKARRDCAPRHRIDSKWTPTRRKRRRPSERRDWSARPTRSSGSHSSGSPSGGLRAMERALTGAFTYFSRANSADAEQLFIQTALAVV